MTKVVDFRQKDPMIWVCDCGCSTFNLLSDGKAACSVCAAPVVGAVDGWQDDTITARPREKPLVPRNDHQGNGSAEFALALIRKSVMSDAAVLIVVAESDSRTRLWAAANTKEQIKWTRERLKDAETLLDDFPVSGGTT